MIYLSMLIGYLITAFGFGALLGAVLGLKVRDD